MAPRLCGQRRVLIAAAAGLVVVLCSHAPAQAPRFFDDDPLLVEPDSQDASKIEPWDIDLAVDLLLNTFGHPGDRENVRAQNVNTLDEVPDSNWFTNRIGAQPLSVEQLRRGPNTIDGPRPGRWVVTHAKTTGTAPGFTVRDEAGEVWFLEFDPRDTPVAATAAIAVASRLFWALGYFVVESYLATLRPEQLVIAESAMVPTRTGRHRRMIQHDVDQVLAQAARNSDGSYRVLAGRALPGRPLGGFRYYGTRPDDPNDIVPHEHRRELRALRVFGAWANLVDLKAGNTLDVLITESGRGVVRHYLQDVGSTFGTGSRGPREWDEGYEYLYEGTPLWKRLVTMGFYIRPWQVMPYEPQPEVGRFEGEHFDPVRWRSRVPAAAVLNAREDDLFWGARRVAAFSDEMIAAMVEAAEYPDPKAAALLTRVLIVRRDKIARAWLPAINPIVDCAVKDDMLRCRNAAVDANVAAPPVGGYRATWARFDNATGVTDPLADETTTHRLSFGLPAAARDASEGYLRASIVATEPPSSSWTRPVDVYLRRAADGWLVIGIERREGR